MGLAKNQYRVLTFLAGEAEELAGVEVADRIERMGRSSVYAALAALQRDGFVEARWDHSESHPRRLVKISAAGRSALTEEQRLLAPNPRAYVEGQA